MHEWMNDAKIVRRKIEICRFIFVKFFFDDNFHDWTRSSIQTYRVWRMSCYISLCAEPQKISFFIHLIHALLSIHFKLYINKLLFVIKYAFLGEIYSARIQSITSVHRYVNLWYFCYISILDGNLIVMIFSALI